MKRNGYARPFPSALMSAPAWSVRTEPGNGGFSVRRYARSKSKAGPNATRGYTARSAPVAQGIERAPPEREVAGSIPARRIPASLRGRPRTPEARVELTSSEARRVGVILFVAALVTGGAGAYWVAAARKRRGRRRWHVSGIRVWGARTF